MNKPIGPPNITAAALVMQFCLSSISTVGAFWIRHRENSEYRFYENPPAVGRYAWILLSFALATIGLLVFSDQFSGFWLPMSNGVHIPLIGWSTALFYVFVLDIACSAILVHLTGGSYRSPFTPIYFILPAMAFFLREAPPRVLFYVVIIVIVFSLGLKLQERTRSRELPPPLGRIGSLPLRA